MAIPCSLFALLISLLDLTGVSVTEDSGGVLKLRERDHCSLTFAPLCLSLPMTLCH